MPLKSLRLRQVLSCVLATAVVLQPAFATEYRIPLRNLKPTQVVPGVGDGEVELDREPVQLRLSVDTLEFEVDPEVKPSAERILLSNTGFGKGTLAPIRGNADFSVNHNCPAELEPGSSCTLSVTPLTSKTDVKYTLTASAAEVTTPASAQLSTVEASVGPRLRVSDSPVYLGELAPGRRANATATLTNTGTADATLSGIVANNGFAVTTTCPEKLPAKASCTIAADFMSWVPNIYSTTLYLAAGENAGKAPTPLTFYAKVYYDPSIVPVLVVNPAILEFEPTVVGATATKTAVLTNEGTAPAVLGKVSSSLDFSVIPDCPAMLEIGASCNIDVKFSARTAGTAPAYPVKLTAQSYASTELLLQGTVVSGKPVPDIDPASLNFENVVVGQSSLKTASLSNPTNKAIPLKGVTVDVGDDVYKLTHDCGTAIAAQGSCTASVTFVPTKPEHRAGRVRVDTGSAVVGVSLKGTGQTALLTANPPKVRIGAVAWPSGTISRPVELFNDGNIPATGLSLASTDPRVHVDAGDCTDTLAARKSCSLTLNFTPSGPGVFSSSLDIATQSGKALSVPISGAALLLSSSPTSLTFEPTKVGMSAPDQAVALTNSGPDAVPFDGLSVTLGDFAQANNCGASLAAGNTCLVAVRFSPKVDGPASGALSVAAYGTGFLNIPLAGSGLPTWLTFSPASVAFAPTYVKEKSTPVDVMLSNSTPDTVTLTTGISISRGGAYYAQSNDCGITLASGQSCTVTLQFTPADASSYPGTLSVVSSIGTYNLTWTGKGQNPRPELSASQLAFGTVDLGERVTKQVTITNSSSEPMALKPLPAAVEDFVQENDCGTAIPGRGTCTMSVSYVPASPGNRIASVEVQTVAGEIARLQLSGTGNGAALSFSPSSVQFGNILLPGAMSTRSVTVSNSGNAALTGLSFATTDGALSVDSSQCPDTLLASKYCVVTLQYAPGAAGPFTTSMLVSSDNGGSQVFAGSGRAVPLTVSPSSLTFPETWVGESAADRTITITNQDNVALVFNGLSITSGQSSYNQSNDCGSGLAAGASCTVTVRFTPAGSGARSGTLTAAAFGSTLFTVALNGTGKAPVLVLSTNTVTFEATNVGSTSPVVNVTVSNPTAKRATITGADVVTGVSEFAQSNDCDKGLAAGASCTVALQMTPTTTKGSKGAWALSSGWGNYMISLSGQGTPPADDGFTHYAVNFLATEFGQASAVRKVQFSNKGTGPLTIQSITLVKGQDDFRESNDCGSVLQPGQYCTLSVQFVPTQGGQRTGGIALMADTGNHYFDLGGVGAAAAGTLTAVTSSDFGSVDVGSSAQRSFTFKNTGDASARNLVAAVTGQDLSLVTNTCGSSSAPTTVSAGNACSITVKYAPTSAGGLTAAELKVSGSLSNGPVSMDLAGTAVVPGLAFDPLTSPDYGVIRPSTAITRTFRLRNVGSTVDVLLAAPSVTGAEFSQITTTGSCSASSLGANGGSCLVAVTFKSAVEGTFTGTITAASKKGAGASLNLSATVQAKMPTIRAWTIPTKVYGTAPFVLTAPISDSPGAFVYTIDNPNIATVSGNKVTLTGAGSATVTATQQPAGVYSSASTTATLTVTKGNPVITFTIPAQTYSLDPIRIAPVTLEATSTSTGALSYESNKPAMVSISGNVANISATGTTAITVTQEATDNYNAATKTASMVVNGPDDIVVLAGRTWTKRAYMVWSDANIGCLSMTKGGLAGWRLGTKDELLVLGSLDTSIRPTWSGWIWSSEGSGGSYTAVVMSTTTKPVVFPGSYSLTQTCTRD